MHVALRRGTVDYLPYGEWIRLFSERARGRHLVTQARARRDHLRMGSSLEAPMAGRADLKRPKGVEGRSAALRPAACRRPQLVTAVDTRADAERRVALPLPRASAAVELSAATVPTRAVSPGRGWCRSRGATARRTSTARADTAAPARSSREAGVHEEGAEPGRGAGPRPGEARRRVDIRMTGPSRRLMAQRRRASCTDPFAATREASAIPKNRGVAVIGLRQRVGETRQPAPAVERFDHGGVEASVVQCDHFCVMRGPCAPHGAQLVVKAPGRPPWWSANHVARRSRRTRRRVSNRGAERLRAAVGRRSSAVEHHGSDPVREQRRVDRSQVRAVRLTRT